MTTDLDNNIHFFIDECGKETHKHTNETKNALNQTIMQFYSQMDENNLIHNQVVPHELLGNCTVKDLQKIAAYYEISGTIRMAKCKKQDIINIIVVFESLPENASIVHHRKQMWAYIKALLQNPKMRQYILF